MRGSFRVPVRQGAPAVVDFISRSTGAFYELVPADLEVNGSEIKVRGGVFRWATSFNLLTALTTVTVKAEAVPPDMMVTYEISFLHTFLFCVVATLGGVPFMIFYKFPWFVIPLWPALIWGYMYWIGGRITGYRMKRFLRKIAAQTSAAQIPGATK
jgi:hypothetical protein